MKALAEQKGAGRHSRTPSIATKGHSATAASTQPAPSSILISEEPFGLDVALSRPIVDRCGALMTALLDLAASFRSHPRDRPAVKQMVDYERRGRK